MIGARAPAFWYQPPGLLARVLGPVGRIVGDRTLARMAQPGRRIGIGVLCIGNFSVGGTGKTPVAIAVARLLQARGATPVFLTRGHGGRLKGPTRVTIRDDPRDTGDEALLLSQVAPTIIARDRVAGAAAAIAAGASVIIMDDGLQNPALAKDFAVAVIDGEIGFGNGHVVPAGPLRAPVVGQMPYVSAVIVMGEGDAGEATAAFARGAGRPVIRARLVPKAGRLDGLRVLAFAGIGRPAKFRATLEALGAEIVRFVPFGDHHLYSEHEAAGLAGEARRAGLTPITTEKDHVRLIGGPARDGLAAICRVVPVEAVFDDEDALVRLIARNVAIA